MISNFTFVYVLKRNENICFHKTYAQISITVLIIASKKKNP